MQFFGQLLYSKENYVSSSILKIIYLYSRRLFKHWKGVRALRPKKGIKKNWLKHKNMQPAKTKPAYTSAQTGQSLCSLYNQQFSE